MDVKPSGYNCRKWTVFTLCLINIVAVSGVITAVILINSLYFEESKETLTQDLKNLEKDAIIHDWNKIKTVLIVMVVTILLVHIFGLLSALKENFCPIVTYTVVIAIVGLLYVWATFELTQIFGALFMLNLFLTIFSFIYCIDINKWGQRVVIGCSGNFVITNTEPNFTQQVMYPNETYNNQSYDRQIYTNRVHPYPNLVITNQVYPIQGHSNQIYPRHNEGYPAQLQCNDQFNGQQMANPMQSMFYTPASSAPPPYDFRDKMSPVYN